MKLKYRLILTLTVWGLFAAMGFSQTTLNFTTSYLTYDMAADSNNLWVATQGGLSRVDLATGTRMVFTSANSPLRENVVNNTFIDSKGNLWVGGNGLYKFDGINWTVYYDLPNGDTIYEAKRITEDRFGRIIVLNNMRSMVIIDSTGFTSLYQSQIPYTPSWITDFDVDSTGALWCATGWGLLHYDGSWTRFDTSNAPLSYSGIGAVRVDKNGIIWITSTNNSNYYALFKYDGINWIQIPGGNATQAAHGKMFLDENNNKYFYYLGTGSLYMFNDSSWTIYTAASGQIEGYTGCMTVKNNTLYSCASITDTAYAYNGTTTARYKINAYDFPGNYFNGITKMTDNSIWMSGYNGVIKTTNGISFETITYPPLASGGEYIHADNYGNLYVAGNGICKYDGANWSSVPVNNYIYNMDVAPNGDVWLAVDSGLKKYDGTNFQNYYFNDPLSPFGTSFAIDVEVTVTGDVWFGDALSFGKLDTTGTFTFYNHNTLPFLSMENNYWVDSDNNGNIYVSSEFGNLVKFDGTTWTVFDSTNSNCPEHCFFWSLVDDGDGNLWFATNNGIVKYDGTTFTNYDNVIYHLGITNGILGMVMDANKNLWYDGIYLAGVFNPDRIEHLEFEPPPMITGTTYFDANTNGALDTTDAGLPHQKLLLLPDSTFRLSNSAGNYFFNVDSGNYSVQYLHDAGWHLTSGTDTLNVVVDSVYECCYDFGINPDSVFHTVELSLVNSWPRCFSNSPFWITAKNTGSVPENFRIYAVIDTVTAITGCYPDTSFSSSDTLFWDFNSVAPFNSSQVLIYLNMPGLSNSAADTINYFAGVQNLSTGATLASDSLIDIVACSFDPNDKTVRPAGILPQHYTLMGDSLVYTIRFQNTGTDTAFTIVVYDTLSTSFDINTFNFISSSHPVDVKYDSKGRLRFAFYNILLPDSNANEIGSHGFVRFSIKAKQGLPDPTVVSNKACIFFDFNLPIITDSVFNTLVYQLPVGITDLKNVNDIKVYPNPSNSVINFQLPGYEKKYELIIYDLLSREILRKEINGNQFVLNADETGSGIFLYTVRENVNTLFRGKFVVVK